MYSTDESSLITVCQIDCLPEILSSTRTYKLENTRPFDKSYKTPGLFYFSLDVNVRCTDHYDAVFDIADSSTTDNSLLSTDTDVIDHGNEMTDRLVN